VGKNQKVFDEALRMGADLADELESRVMSYGRWLLTEVFGNDAAAALDDKSKNPIWMELVRRAGGPTPRIGKKMLYVAVRLAAYDKRIGDQAWQGLDAGRKELLLPLREDRRLREAAQHVSKWNLTQAMTEAYVGELMAASGETAPPRLSCRRGRILPAENSKSPGFSHVRGPVPAPEPDHSAPGGVQIIPRRGRFPSISENKRSVNCWAAC
jgi:hypothetical protein